MDKDENEDENEDGNDGEMEGEEIVRQEESVGG
jgi:hypothetical protein